jgi:hypothetical protein
MAYGGVARRTVRLLSAINQAAESRARAHRFAGILSYLKIAESAENTISYPPELDRSGPVAEDSGPVSLRRLAGLAGSDIGLVPILVALVAFSLALITYFG